MNTKTYEPYGGQLQRYRRLSSIAAFGPLASAAIGFPLGYDKATAILMMISMVLVFRWMLVYCRIFRDMRRRFDEVPDHIKRGARAIYDNDTITDAAIECNESHISGDCPLCGAE